MEFEVGGKTKRLRYTFNALADIEAKSDRGIASLFSEERMGFHSIRLMFWAGLKHAEPGLTVDRAGQILEQLINEGNTLEEIVSWIMEAFSASGIAKGEDENFPQPEKSGSRKKSASSSEQGQLSG